MCGYIAKLEEQKYTVVAYRSAHEMCLFVVLLNTATKVLKISFFNSLITIYTVLHEAHSLLLTPINRTILSNRPGTVSS